MTPTYDANGNLTSDGTFAYGYDAESRLTSASGAGVTASYAYDAQGRRKSKTVNGTTTLFVQDPQGRPLLDYAGAGGQVAAWYAVGVGPNDVLSQVSGTTRGTPIPDLQGSIIATLDAASGALTKAGYLPYGESVSNAGTFRYTGARIDAETSGLYDFRARMYAPVLGRFLQVDPIGMLGGANLYAYVGNDPLNLLDPYGLAAEAIQGAVPSAGYQTEGIDSADTALYPSSEGVGGLVKPAGSGALDSFAGDAAERIPTQLEINSAAGKAFQARVSNYGAETLENFVEEVSIRPNTATGQAPFRIRADGLGTNPDTQIVDLLEAKGSVTAPLTKNQTLGFPLLEQYGGTIAGKNGGINYPAGTLIRPGTGVRIIRPSDLPEGY